MAIALPLLRFLALASLVLAEAPLAVRAETVHENVRVSAEIVVSCTLDVRVPRVGTPERRGGAARFSVSCMQGAIAMAAACPAPCPQKKPAEQRADYRTGSRGDGATIATVLF